MAPNEPKTMVQAKTKLAGYKESNKLYTKLIKHDKFGSSGDLETLQRWAKYNNCQRPTIPLHEEGLSRLSEIN